MSILVRSPYSAAGGARTAVERANEASARLHPERPRNPDADLDAEIARCDLAMMAARKALKKAADTAHARAILAKMAGIQTRLANARDERMARRLERERAIIQDRDRTPAPRIPDTPRTVSARAHRVGS